MREKDKSKAGYEIRPEGTSTILSELAMQHMQSKSYYQDFASALKDDDGGVADYFTTFAEYHDKMLAELNTLISDMSAGVNTPSHDGQSLLKEEEQSVNRAVIEKNISELTDLAHRNEHTISQAYEQALGNAKLVDFAEETIHRQHQEILVWLNRADRYKTVPQEFNEHYEIDDKQ